jgi:hypothetical protein
VDHSNGGGSEVHHHKQGFYRTTAKLQSILRNTGKQPADSPFDEMRQPLEIQTSNGLFAQKLLVLMPITPQLTAPGAQERLASTAMSNTNYWRPDNLNT